MMESTVIGANGVLSAEDIAEYKRLAEVGHVDMKTHPQFPNITLVDYTREASFSRSWTPHVEAARGLIFDADTGRIIARPFSKFFNHGQREGVQYPSGNIEVTNKEDGSLGILFTLPNGEFCISTRGSFHSPQALHATQLFRERYLPRFQNPSADCHLFHAIATGRYTVLFEIVYPQNRIVLDYGELDDLILLGAIDTLTGRDAPRWVVEELVMNCYFRTPQRFFFKDLGELMEHVKVNPRKNAEGFVVRFYENDMRVKFKYDEYCRLHSLLTEFTPKDLLEILRMPDEKDRTNQLRLALEKVPDEFDAWVTAWIDKFHAQAKELMSRVDEVCIQLEEMTPLPDKKLNRKKQAEWLFANVKDDSVRYLVFQVLSHGNLNMSAVLRHIDAPKGKVCFSAGTGE